MILFFYLGNYGGMHSSTFSFVRGMKKVLTIIFFCCCKRASWALYFSKLGYRNVLRVLI